VATSSTEAVYALLRTHLLAFEGSTGASLSDRFADRIYLVRAPDDTAYPYGTLRFLPLVMQGAYNMDRQEGYLEVMLYDRPASHAAALEASADLVQQAFLRFADATSGLVFCREVQRDTLPVPLPGMERDIVTIRLAIHLVLWPTYITDYATS
jgi:hypothetical protein